MKEILIVAFVCILTFGVVTGASANESITINIENNTESVDEAVDSVENILDDFNNNSEELKEKTEEIIAKNSENFFVKLFKSIINAITKFLDTLLEIALEATMIR